MSQPPLSVIGSDPLMRRGANRGPASTTEREWLWQPYLKIMAGLTPIYINIYVYVTCSSQDFVYEGLPKGFMDVWAVRVKTKEFLPVIID